MSYEPTNWKKGDVVTAAKLNKLEGAVASITGVHVLELVAPDGAPPHLSETFAQIGAYMSAGVPCYLKSGDYSTGKNAEIDLITEIYYADEMYIVETGMGQRYTTDLEDGYPEYEAS